MNGARTAPLSQTQLGIYLDCVRMGKGAYNGHFLYTLDNGIDMKRLAAAIEKAVAAHPYMNVRIAEQDGEPRQYVPDDIEEYRQTVTEMTEEEWKRELPRLMATPLELMGGRLFRFDLVQTERAKYLLRTTHHVFFDRTASNALFADIAAAYSGQKITPESYNALDAARDEAERRGGPEYEAARKWYEENFSGLDTESLPLPDLYGKPDAFETYVHNFPLNYDAMRDFCKARQIGASALASAAFGFTLGIYTHQREALFSTIYHGRKDERTAHIVGMFVKTMPVYCRWDADSSVADLLTGLTAQMKGSRDNDLFSFADLNRICPMNDKPLFAYHGMIKTTSTFCGLPCQEEILDRNTTGSPLEVELMGEPGGMMLRIEYNSGKYSRDFIETFARTYEHVLNQLMSAEYIRDIEPADREQIAILDGFNATDNPYDNTQTIVSLFRKAAKENAGRTAVIFKDKKWTYRELNDITERLAGSIAGKGLGQGDVVSILIPRGEYMPIASMGALKAGCAYQPLDATYPPERLNFMVKDSGAKLLITTEELRPLITDYAGDVLMVKDIPTLPLPKAELEAPRPEDLFILLYTSGSTGTPKGVRLTHANLVCFVNWYHRYYDLQPEDCVGQYASFGFDACMMDMYSSLTRGASVCIIPEEIRLDMNAINEYLEKNRVTHQFMTTQVARQFAVNIENHTLKTLFFGGEKLVPLTPPAGYKLQNGYGPTECTCCVAVYHVKEYMENIPIGKANDNVKLYIVDSEGKRVPVGALGELWVSGRQVGDGYLNLPDKTAEVFIDNPFNSDPDYNKVYKTGDIVRYRADGNIEFFGRRDGQVKIRGFRIELSEVEAVIRQFPGVTDATVAAFDNESGEGKYLAAYVVSDEKIDVKAMGDFIRSKKPPYMVPAVTMQIDKIPLNQNSKVNRHALPKPVIERNVSTAAANDAERAFCKIFGDILQIENVGATEDFFSLGGTSILVTLVIIEAEKAGYRVTFQDVFSRPTPRALAELFADKTTKTGQLEKDEVRDYDYSKLQPILDANTLESFKAGARQPLGDILLTGATGYLGIHILHELLERHDGRVYCLMRGKGSRSAESRLKNQLFYYFENTYDELLNKRLFVIDGDITKPIPKLPVSTVINCAAVVKHFSAGTEIEDTNVGGVRNLIDYCLTNTNPGTGHTRLIQVSTMSTVSMGMSQGETLEAGRMIGERDLYFGQLLENKYVRSKFLAERLIVEAVAEKKLNAKIMRVGNLAARYSDGEFQINYGTNSAMGRLKIYALLGVCPYEQMDAPMEFSPIDEVAKAILLLSQTPRECVIFHPYNHNVILSGNVFAEMSKLGLHVKPVEREDFDAAIARAEEDPAKAKLLTSMLAYQNGDKRGAAIPRHNAYTMQTLYRMGYRWPVTSWDYVEQFISAIKALGFFDF